MKLTHHVNARHWKPRPEPITDAYQAEIDAAMRKAEKAWKQAVKAAERAEGMASRHQADVDLRADAEWFRRQADTRWQELKEYEALMVGARGSKHSGRGSVRRQGNRGTL